MFNKTIVRRFTWTDERSSDSGLSGWVMKGFESLEPSQTFGLAHDALEHYDATLGADAEMDAFGAILWGRGCSGWRFGMDGVESALVSDIQGFVGRGMEWCTPLPIKTLSRYAAAEDVEHLESNLEEIERRITKALLATAEFDDEPPRVTTAEEAALRASHMVQWMRRGALRVNRRWSRAGGWQAFMDCFTEIADSPLAKGRYCEVGDRLVIRIFGGERGVKLIHRDGYLRR